MVKVRTPLSARNSNTVTRRGQITAGKRKGARATNWKARTSCVFAEPPPGCIFKTSFSAKYYGKASIMIDSATKLTAEGCIKIVKSVIANAKKSTASKGGSVATTFSITDRGIDFETSNTGKIFDHVPVEELYRIVPGTLVSKSGKSYTVALVIQHDNSAETDRQSCHVFQCAHAEDAAHMHDAARRMWRDHLFSNLLDVSTEEAQDGFDSFMIRQDMETAAQRCNEVLEQDARKANDRCSMVLKTDLEKGFDFLEFISKGGV